MSLRPPSQYRHDASGKSPLNVLEYELMAERADSLGRAGLNAEAALDRLRQAGAEASQDLIDDTAEKVHALFIQREICGLRNSREVIARYGIPGNVIVRLGVSRKKPEGAS